MAVAHTPRSPRPTGPHAARAEDAAALNQVFSDAFTERYRRDGLVGVRVPFLNPAIWKFAIEDAAGGAQIWRDDRGDIAAFNIAHASGAEGWMGPLAVRPDLQSAGIGKLVVTSASDWLVKAGCRTVGLETMPRTMDNIGFYSTLGYLPGNLTITVTVDAGPAARPPSLLSRLSARAQDDAVGECLALTQSLIPGWDFSREIRLTQQLGLGETVLFRDGDRLAGFALSHTAPLVEGRALDEMRVLKLVLESETLIPAALSALAELARRHHARRVAIRAQTDYVEAYRRIIEAGGRVRWTDLRMTLGGYAEPRAASGLIWSNWEI
jgi:GNAT superfamily N-acetyltransferase